MNLDVVDGVAWTSSQLRNPIRARSVQDAVNKINHRLGSKKIGRLRFFGHGLSTGGMIVGGGTGCDVETQAITIIGKELKGQGYLKLLVGKFVNTSWVELHPCTFDEVKLVRVLKRLADLWDTRVVAAVGDQSTSGDKLDKFEGQVIEADGRRANKPVRVSWK
jgi:hypothetical protein